MIFVTTSAREPTTPNMEHEKPTLRKNQNFAFRIHEHGTS